MSDLCGLFSVEGDLVGDGTAADLGSLCGHACVRVSGLG